MCGFCNVWVCVCVGVCMCWFCKVCVYLWVLKCVGVHMRGFCNVWVCLCVGFVMCGCFDNCVDVLLICVLVFTVFFVLSLLRLFILI